jgi:hypothetical protein
VNEDQANNVAQALAGRAWQSGGGIWLVIVERSDGHLVVLSDDVVCEYENESKFEESSPQASILLV